jgi:hypothetical protein
MMAGSYLGCKIEKEFYNCSGNCLVIIEDFMAKSDKCGHLIRAELLKDMGSIRNRGTTSS